MHPRVGVRLRHLKELSLDFLPRILFPIGQNEQELVGHRRSGTGLIRTVASTGAGLPINGAVPQVGAQRVLEKGQQRCEFLLS